ncbi:hypothetical protein SLE2022_249680 [Rubroshorea leprosula]
MCPATSCDVSTHLDCVAMPKLGEPFKYAGDEHHVTFVEIDFNPRLNAASVINLVEMIYPFNTQGQTATTYSSGCV